MPKYLFTYHGGGMPESEEEQAKHMAAWGAWMGELGDAFVDQGAPVSMAKTVTPDGVQEENTAYSVGGYGLVEAADIDAASEMAKGCPVITLSGGSVQVSETFEIDM